MISWIRAAAVYAVALYLAVALHAAPPVPVTSGFQAVVTNAAGTRLTGTADFTFRYFDAVTAGTLLLTETQTGVALTNGLLNTALGSGALSAGVESSFVGVCQNHNAVFVEVTVSQSGITETLSPRAALLSAPFALHTADSALLGGFSSGYYLNTTGNPQAKSGNSNGPLLEIMQGDVGTGLSVFTTNSAGVYASASNLGIGLAGNSVNGVGVIGQSDGGAGAYDGVEGQTGSGTGVNGVAFDTGVGVTGQSSKGIGVLARHYDTTTAAPALQADNSSGVAGVKAISATILPSGVNDNSVAIAGYNNQTGYGVQGYCLGGYGVVGFTGTSGRSGLYGSTVGSDGNGVAGSAVTGQGVSGVTSSGVGVMGSASTGVAMKAVGQGSTTVAALQIDNGALKISGPDNAHKAAFVHTAAEANSFGIAGRPKYITEIDNVYCNGDPNAIVIATHSYNPGGSGGSLLNRPFGVYYDGAHWAVYLEDQGPMGAASIVGYAFNVLIIKP